MHSLKTLLFTTPLLFQAALPFGTSTSSTKAAKTKAHPAPASSPSRQRTAKNNSTAWAESRTPIPQRTNPKTIRGAWPSTASVGAVWWWNCMRRRAVRRRV
ncbi:MAG: hypothetical protein L6R42_002767 [Xanthoria sp. 1 TBL-2021]|nr:MAG: hypothetical protein L6R42_002767 [Xanthoria sp. 1 TBL-2021]